MTRCSAAGTMARPLRFQVLFILSSAFLLQQPAVVDAFATYLLSSSGCMVDLSTDEVIMNKVVVAAEESDDKSMFVHVAGTTADYSGATSPLSHSVDTMTFPLTLQLQVLTTDTTSSNTDYQFVLDAQDGAHFTGGSCDDETRIAGRNRELVEVVIEKAGAKVWAGWATSHEAVRLTPVLHFVNAKEASFTTLPDHNPIPNEGASDTAARELKGSQHNSRQRDRRQRPAKRADRNAEGKQSQSQRNDNAENGNRQRHHVAVPTKDERRAVHAAHLENQKAFASNNNNVPTVSSSAAEARNRHRHGVADKRLSPIPTVSFNSGSYYAGMAIFVVATALAIQLCLVASQRGGGNHSNKGRRE